MAAAGTSPSTNLPSCARRGPTAGLTWRPFRLAAAWHLLSQHTEGHGLPARCYPLSDGAHSICSRGGALVGAGPVPAERTCHAPGSLWIGILGDRDVGLPGGFRLAGHLL